MVDMQKAYDSVEWIYIEQIMEELDFPTKFVAWVMTCVKTVNYSILFNRETLEPFNAAKGLRQGDPMSPFLFAIAMEYLNRTLLGLKQGDVESVKALNDCFLIFSAASDQQANLSKSAVYFGGMEANIKEEILQVLGYTHGELPVKKASADTDSFIWIQAYWSQLFIIPVKVLKLIEAYCRSYLWSGANTITKKALVAWERICLPKSVGGLNLINLQICNKAAIAKIVWDLEHKQDKLWVKWIKNISLIAIC
uniref:Reverse transcriptase domain-containing protein n=1 Tax=Nicotiana tabacum TaxID=4097 RepID=A0A1S4DRU3_TOBAC|nr:PREDICTED: uncharacterized protein LOC107832785 [Nicotiana tabacum]